MPPSPDVVLQQEGEHFSSHVKKKKKKKKRGRGMESEKAKRLFLTSISTYKVLYTLDN